MSLREYKRKRDFRATAEPPPAVYKRSRKKLRFVIQKHAASHLHYDFRLELDGVLKSWAVPKGPPFAKGERRLAMEVEDHPLDYATFEGLIPKGQYGGGTVMVWDIGDWEPLGDAHRDLAKGKLHFTLRGKKLKGEWALVRMHRSENQWLLLKSGKSMRPVSKAAADRSALTRRTMKRIATDADATWRSGKAEGGRTNDKMGSRASSSRRANSTRHPSPDTRPSRPLRFVEPMKAKLVEQPPSGNWLWEIKWDGYRALALKDGKEVRLLTRNAKDITGRYEGIAPAIAGLPCKKAILDGEIVALDPKGRSSFQLLQAYEMHLERPPICYYLFDLLAIDGEDLRAKPLEERRKRLQELLEDAQDPLRFSAAFDRNVEKLLTKVQKLGMEGLIGKRAGSQYETGRRSGAWIKLKVQQEQEFVIGGYTQPQGTRKYFGALLVGFFEKGALHFAAKVGTGFSHEVLRMLHTRMQPLRRKECPFVNLPAQRNGRWGQGITRAEMSRCTWIKPQLVCQIRFTEWTGDKSLRHPAFLGLRDDKDARAVRREAP